MAFFIVMFICNMLIPLIMILCGYFMWKHPPKKINWAIGYRTKMSMKSKDTWKFAHDYCGRLWFKIGLILLIPTGIVQIPFIHSSDDVIGIMTLVIETVQIVFLFVSLIPVEIKLRKIFDGNGNRK
ncbi:SdpI/YhfL protein family protein [Acetitomaculum ruminis DSM 5522]|uniref:SdpI/YhfL protein family protein n=1 Tax=Acetitomaculum ruminis DSM 5522 TaxID=1120918 RepID=A0A1I1AFX8_9FIRM|nr:SdpI family protein [Acetitomaculum ruminis]SFB35390.1 SdpI/YhfL protein family protein [Acetitomaculum ruminis DSM 5522]